MNPSTKRLISRFDTFIFDWDGTLNSMHMLMRVNEAVKRAVGAWNTDSTIKDFKRMDHNLKNRLEAKERENDILATLLDAFLLLSKPRLHNDSIAVLRKLHRSRKNIALFSNGRGYRLMRELSYLGIIDYFDVVVSAKEIGALKPNPTGLKAILHLLNDKPSKVLYIGDMVDDIITAKVAGVPSCAIADGFDSYHKLNSVNPDYIFKSMEAFYKAL